MAKPATESPADKLKREQAEAEVGETITDKELADLEAADNSRHNAAERLGLSEEDNGIVDPRAARQQRMSKGQTAQNKLVVIAQTIPASTPPEHVLFGAGGNHFTVGDLRALTGFPS